MLHYIFYQILMHYSMRFPQQKGIKYYIHQENESSFSNKNREEHSVVVANTTKITFKKGIKQASRLERNVPLVKSKRF